MDNFGYVFGWTCIFLALVLWVAGKANADPMDPYCFDQRLCDGDFGSTFYCPDTGGFVGPFGACDALVTGPYAPGGIRPNQGIAP